MDHVARYDYGNTGESFMLKVRYALSVPDMDRNFIALYVMREAEINVRTSKLK